MSEEVAATSADVVADSSSEVAATSADVVADSSAEEVSEVAGDSSSCSTT